MNNSTYALCLLAVALLRTGAPGFAQQATRDLFLVAGQSNAVGFDAYASELPRDASDARVLFWWHVGDPPPDDHDVTSGGQWTTLQPQPKGQPFPTPTPEAKKSKPRQYGNFAHAEGGFGPEIGFCRTLQERGAGAPAVIKVAFSGTSIPGDWNPEGSGSAGACYRALIKETRAALAAAAQQGIQLNLRAILWIQGESDANAEQAPHYEKHLAKLINSLRKDLDCPEMRALVSVNARFGNGQNPHIQRIVAAQRALALSDPLVLQVDTSSAETLPPSHTHFTAKGTLDVGRLFAQAWLTAVNAMPAESRSGQKRE